MGQAIAWTIASLGGVGGILLLLSKGVITGSISHFWKRYLARKDQAHEASRCPHDYSRGREGQIGTYRSEDPRRG